MAHVVHCAKAFIHENVCAYMQLTMSGYYNIFTYVWMYMRIYIYDLRMRIETKHPQGKKMHQSTHTCRHIPLYWACVCPRTPYIGHVCVHAHAHTNMSSIHSWGKRIIRTRAWERSGEATTSTWEYSLSVSSLNFAFSSSRNSLVFSSK
jgi:hypothetical protein